MAAFYGDQGRLRIVSAPRLGTLVSIVMPTVPPGRAGRARRAPAAVSLLALIVDDEAPARAELRYLLERVGGVEVVGEAASVREALALASRLDYDVVFCDISMPELTRHRRGARDRVLAPAARTSCS